MGIVMVLFQPGSRLWINIFQVLEYQTKDTNIGSQLKRKILG